MKTEPQVASRGDDIDVMILFAPRTGPDDEFECAVAEWSRVERATLVVLPNAVDVDILERLESAGADLCTVAPTPEELFTNVERARCLHRRTRLATETHDRTNLPRHGAYDDPFDAFWRERPRRS
jgi:hypothetical protein